MTFPSEFTHDGPNDVSKLTKAALVAAFLSVNVRAVQVLNHEYWSTIYIQIIECDDATEAPYYNLVFASFYRAYMEHLIIGGKRMATTDIKESSEHGGTAVKLPLKMFANCPRLKWMTRFRVDSLKFFWIHMQQVSYQRSVIMKSVPTVELSGGAFSDPMGWSPSICLRTGWEGTPALTIFNPTWVRSYLKLT